MNNITTKADNNNDNKGNDEKLGITKRATRMQNMQFPSSSCVTAAIVSVTPEEEMELEEDLLIDSSQLHHPQQQQQQHLLKSSVKNPDPKYMLSALFAGIGSGAFASVMCAPLDLIRVRMQVWADLVQGPTTTSAPKKPMSQKSMVVKILKDIYARDGYKGYFRGLGASLVTVPFFWGVYFPLYDESKRKCNYHYPNASTAYIHCGSAVFAGAVSDLICNPMFVVRTRLQTEALHNLILEKKKQQQVLSSSAPLPPVVERIKDSGILQTMKGLYKEGGYPIFWRGMSANIIGLSHVAVQFPVYERLKLLFLHQSNESNNTKGNKHNTVIDLLLASGLSKMTAMILTYPHEVLRSRMMDSRGSKGQSLVETSKKIYRNEGIVGFYAGLPISMVRVIPNCCITFMTYELLLRYGQENF